VSVRTKRAGGTENLSRLEVSVPHRRLDPFGQRAGNIAGFAVSKSQVRVDIEIAKLASERAAALAHRELGRGRASLAAIAATSGFVGLLGTVFGIARLCCGSGSDYDFAMAITQSLSDWMAPAILIAIFALWCQRYVRDRVEFFDLEMRAVTLELANLLSLLGQRIRE
jgi:biopolymer transport protein ExbB/TolQ